MPISEDADGFSMDEKLKNSVMNMRLVISLIGASMLGQSATAQKVKLQREASRPVVRVSIKGNHFTDFFFPDTIAKPVLYRDWETDRKSVV